MEHGGWSFLHKYRTVPIIGILIISIEMNAEEIKNDADEGEMTETGGCCNEN